MESFGEQLKSFNAPGGLQSKPRLTLWGGPDRRDPGRRRL